MARRNQVLPAIEQNFIDKAIGYIAPVAAAKRMQARMTMALSGLGGGGYKGAKLDRAALSNWRTKGGGSPQGDIGPDLPNLRERTRDLVRNAPIATGGINQLCTSVIGTGLSLSPTPDAEFLGLTPEQLAKWKKDVKREWNLFANSKDCDIRRELNFYQLQDLVFRSRMESGDVFVLTPSVPRGNLYDLTLQVVEADRVSNPDRKADSDTIIDGIEVDAYGAPVACHVSDKYPNDLKAGAVTWQRYPFFGNNNRRNVLHLKKTLRPGQVRGVPDFAPLIEILKQLERYTEAELQAAVTNAFFSLFVQMDAQAFGTLFDEDSQKTIVDGAKKWDGNLDNPGRAVNLLPGETVIENTPGRPNSEFDPFVQAIIRQIGMALEVPYEVLIMHFQSSYSAAKGALLTAWRTYRKWRDWMSTDFCQPIFELMLEEAVAKRRILAPGFFADKAVRAAWCNAGWVGDGPGSLDPVKDAAAAKARVDLTISTLEDESILHDGKEWEGKYAQRVKEQQLIVEGGLQVVTPGTAIGPQGEKTEVDDEELDDDPTKR